MVALQALAEFSKASFGSNMTVKMTASGSTHSYNIDSSNLLVLQSRVVSIQLTSSH